MKEYLIESHDLCKLYDLKYILNRVNIHVEKGRIYGLIGPNGAGKSTLLKIIMNLIPADSGRIFVFGNQDGMTTQGLNKTGSMIEQPYFYDNLSGEKNLQIHSRYMGYHEEKRIKEVLHQVGLDNAKGKKVSQYSMGMRQRLAIARAILIKPELLILDEPINALDPDGIKKMRELFLYLKKEYGMTIIVSSHILSEMDQLADDIGILNQGKIIKETSLQKIHEENKDRIIIKVDDLAKTSALLEDSGIHNFKIVKENQIQIFETRLDTSLLSELLVKNEIKLYRLDTIRKSLEEYFFAIIEENCNEIINKA